MPNLVSLTHPSLQILGKTQIISNFQISGESFINKNCRNSRTNHDIDMIVGPVTKLYKRNITVKKSIMMSCQQIVTSLPFFWFITTLHPPQSWIPVAWSIKLTFSLTIPFYLTKTKNRTKKSLTDLSYYCFE